MCASGRPGFPTDQGKCGLSGGNARAMAIAIALVVLAVASVLFYFISPWNLTPLASNWGAIDDTVLISFIVTGIVFVAVTGFMAWCVYRYRYDPARRSDYEPENKKLEAWLTGLTTLGIAALLAPGLIVWEAFVHVPDDAHKFEALGQQWHWRFRFPGEDGEFGRVHPRFMGADNPYGIDPDDPGGADDVLVNTPVIYLPVDEPAHVHLRSRDVLHNFMVPQFRAKMDALPGQMSYFWFTPTKIGEYQAFCAQHCGIAHFAMRAAVHVVEQDQFDEWLAQHPTFAETQDRSPGDATAGRGLYAPCAACHGADGEGNHDMNAPRLAGLDPWYIERQLRAFRNGARGAHEDDTYGRQMAPMARTLSDDEAVRHVTAYIATLPDQHADYTIEGDLRRGERLFRTCATCHGTGGQGREALNAPRLAGIDDWYLARQLRNFREGVRGDHPEDPYGNQMIDMVQHLDDSAIDDLASWISTLKPPEDDTSVARVEDH